MKKETSIAETKETTGSKKLTIMFVIECIMFAGLLLAFILYKTGIIEIGNKEVVQTIPEIQQEMPQEEPTIVTPEPIDVEKAISEADKSIIKSLQMTLPGTYVTGDGKCFEFDFDKETYSGYINDDNPTGHGTYALQYDNGVITIKVISGAIVKTYTLEIGLDGSSILLTDKDTGEVYEAVCE